MQPEPLREAEKIFNQLGIADPFDQEAVSRLQWRLQSLRRKQADDFVTRTALAKALLHLGRRAEAVEEMETAYGLRTSSLLPAYQALMATFSNAGYLDRALTLSNDLLGQPEFATEPYTIVNHAWLLYAVGDVKTLIEFMEKAPASVRFNTKAPDVLRVAGLEEHFATHQTIVNSLVRGLQCHIESDELEEEDDPPMLVSTRYILADGAECRRLQRVLTDRLGDYYESQGLPRGIYLSYLHTSLMPMPVFEGTAAA